MFRIRFHGRGGQGMKTASRILGTAFFHAGYQVQDAPRYGAERRGAPIFAYVRADESTINERGVITSPDLVVVADDTLVGMPAAGVTQGLDAHSVLLINSLESAATWQRRLNTDARILVLATQEEVEDRASLPYIGSRCAAAAAALTGVISREILLDALREELAYLPRDVVQKNHDIAQAVFDAIEEKLRRNTEIVLKTATEQQILPRQAAIELATERVRKAMNFRQYSLFSRAPRFV